MARVQNSEGDSWRWLSVSEDSLLLQNDLLHLVGHISLPCGIGESSTNEEEYGLPVLDGKTPSELVDIINRECSVRSTTYTSLMEYRFNALKELWKVLLERNKKSKKKDDSSSSNGAKGSGKGEGFASRVSLVLIFPVLKSLCKIDPKLSQDTARLLLESLQSCDPLSLSSEPTDCISGIEDILCSWLKAAQEDDGLEKSVRERQLQTAASALVALAVAVGTGGILLRTVNKLQSLDSSHSSVPLIVPKILHKLLHEHIVTEEPSALTGDNHLLCWGYESQSDTSVEGVFQRSVVFDGSYLYVTSSNGEEILKLGTGICGTLRGYVYARNELQKGWFVYVNGCDKILYKKASGDGKQDQPFLSLLDRNTLEDCGNVHVDFPYPSEPYSTLYLISDGLILYWIYYFKNQDVVHPITKEKVKQHLIYLQELQLQERDSNQFYLTSTKERLLLNKPSEEHRGSSDVVKSFMRSGSYSLSAMFGAKDDQATSCGLGLKQMQSGSAYCTGSSLILVMNPPPSSGSRSLFGVASNSAKALSVNFCYSLSSGLLVSQSDLPTSNQLHCGLSKGGNVQSLAVSYDLSNHCLWSVTDDWVDVWTCVGKVKPAAHILALRLGKSLLSDLIPELPDSDTISITEAIELVLRHSGIESCRLTPGKDFTTPVTHSLGMGFLQRCCDILEYSLSNHQLDNCLSAIITLQAVLPNYVSSSDKKYSSEVLAALKDRIRTCLAKLLEMRSESPTLYRELKKLICRNCKSLYLDSDDHATQFLSLLSSDLHDLSQDILVDLAGQLRHACTLEPSVLRILPLIASFMEEDGSSIDMRGLENDDTAVIRPLFPPVLQCASVLLNVCLRSLNTALQELETLSANEDRDPEKLGAAKQKMEDERGVLIRLCSELKVFESCNKTLDYLADFTARAIESDSTKPTTKPVEDSNASDTPPSVDEEHTKPSLDSVRSVLEKTCKGSVLGALLPPLLAVLSDSTVCNHPMAIDLLKHLSRLGRKSAEVCKMLYNNLKDIKLPAPWANGRTLETIHPVRDNYKFKETVCFPGAKHLYLKFDPRCSTQYDYDKVIVYAGEDTWAPKVSEYGGNTQGFGSRSVLGKGWPKDLVKVDGDKVTFSFEMKSGREHSTPDKAMWGFACTVRPQEISEDSTPLGLPFLLDVHLSIASVNCLLIGQLFKGAPPTDDELSCKQLMKSSLLQRCVWSTNVVMAQPSLLPETVAKMRTLFQKPRPVMRASTSQLLQVDLLEHVIVSTCLKHHGIDGMEVVISTEKSVQENSALVEEVFNRINGLERCLLALAELESKWWSDVEDITKDNIDITKAFFHDFAHQESLVKSFELLCCLMKIELTNDVNVALEELRGVMERCVKERKEADNEDVCYKVKSIVDGVIERSRLLYQVNISQASAQTHATPPSNISRSISVPAHRSDLRQIRRQRSDGMGSDLLLNVPSDKSGQETILDEIFQFIGAKPEEAVSSASFLSAASAQHTRAKNRIQALEFLQSLLTDRQLGPTVKHILRCVGGVLRHGPSVEDITCSGLVNQVRDAFADVMLAVVKLASHQPVSCINTIALLSIIPYTRDEEACLVRSGLVKLLDYLCSLSNLPQTCDIGKESKETTDTDEDNEAFQRVTALAWAAFQVLAERCVSWETTRNVGFISSGLAQQVSQLLTNHLSRALESLVTSESGTSDTLQEALSMLLGLARSQMGRTILSQPACVSKLLVLLTDQRPSPKLVLIALQLCRIALPLMTIAECSQVVIPPNPFSSSMKSNSSLASNIITLLMAKLAEYLVPSMAQPSIANHIEEEEGTTDHEGEDNLPSSPVPSARNEIDENGQASLYIHCRQGESAAELIQDLLNKDSRHSSLHIDSALRDEGMAEIYTDTYKSCFRRALRLANSGFLVSIEPPVGGGASERGPSGTESDIKKSKAESSCKKKNLELLKTDPPRPFLSGTVAYSLAAEIIGLLNGLLADTGSAQVWKKALQDVLQNSLKTVPSLLPELQKYCNRVLSAVRTCSTPPIPDRYLSPTCLANATFAALGGFKDIVRPNMRVEVLGGGIERCYGTVVSISERRGVASVQFSDDEYCFGTNSTLEIPLSRLRPPAVASLSLSQLDLQKHLCDAVITVVKTEGPTVIDPHSGMDASLRSMGLCRMFAELRTRVFQSLSYHVNDEAFRDELLCNCSLMEFFEQSKIHQQGERLSVVETHCLGLRMLYRDCARPPTPKVEKSSFERKRYQLDISRKWPPLKSCSFSHNSTSVVYQGPTTSTGAVSGSEEQPEKPKGALILTMSPIPRQAPSFYWELELVQVESGSNSPHVTMGYCPDVKKGNGGQEAWSYPDGTCLIRSSGRGCQVQGDDRMKWKKINLESPFKSGDIIGIGWVKEDTPTDTKGLIYFTVNGVRIPQTFTDAPANMYPFLHLQKKSIRVKANFGDRPYTYVDGHAHRDAADVPEGESLEERVALLKELPFYPWDEEEEENTEEPPPPVPTDPLPPSSTSQESVDTPSPDEAAKYEPLVIGQPTKELDVPKPITKEYNYNNSTHSLYPLRLSFDTMLESGPLIRPGGGGNQLEEEEEGETQGTHAEEDLHALLVKAWEAKVFPKIQRRFRNDQERKSGLEQIRGALQLGMDTIAQETVEFLYEENGGLPKDLHFPTIEDVKADLERFTINRVKKGSSVVVLKDLPYARCGVRAMQKTQGLTGVVLSVDDANELVQVECYVPSDGALVRFWYPVIYLERPPKGYRKPSALRGAESVNILVHRELLQCEMTLSSMYCRSSLITLHSPYVSRPSPISVPSFLSLVANHDFCQPSIEGLCYSTCPALSPSLHSSVSTVLSTPHEVFYSSLGLVDRVCNTLLTDPPKDLAYIVSEICNHLATVSVGIGSGEFVVPDGKDCTDVVCHEGSFMVVSSIEEKSKNDSKPSYRYPWGRVFIYRGGQGKGGQMPLQEVIRYPNEMVQSLIQQYCGPAHPSCILPTNRIHLKLGGCSPHPGRLVSVMGVPKLLPLVMSVADSLSRKIHVEAKNVTRKNSDRVEMLCNGLSHSTLSLINILCRVDCPPVLKEKLFQTLSNTMWTLSLAHSIDSSGFPFIPTEFVSGIVQELEQVYETESISFSSNNKNSNKFPPEGSISTGGLGRFSTYFQTLLELVLATQHYTSLYHKPQVGTPTHSDAKKSSKKDSASAKNKSWLKYVTRIIGLLQRISNDRPIDREFYNLFRKSLPVRPENKLLVITGLDPSMEKGVATDIITEVCNKYGGIRDSDGLYLPCKEVEIEEKESEEKESESKPDEKKDPIKVKKSLVCGGAVIELNCSEKTSVVSTALLSSSELQSSKKELAVSSASRELKCGDDKKGNDLLREFLQHRLLEGKALKKQVIEAVRGVFNMAAYDGGKVLRSTIEDKGAGETYVRLLLQQLVGPDKDMKKVVTGICEGKKGVEIVSETKLMEWLEKEAKRDVRVVWCGLFAAGLDLHLSRCGFLPNDACLCSPNLAKDTALTLHVDALCRKLGVVSANLQPWDLTISEVDLASNTLVALQNDSSTDINLRFLQLKQFNRQFSWLLPMVDLCNTHPSSLGSCMSQVSQFLFYDTKISFLHSVLNSSTRRSLDQAPPEIKMDPLEIVGGLPSSVFDTQFCQAARQMLSIPSPQLCVPLASGGDPTYAFNVKLSGEEVHGTSGSFRHFLWQVVKELQSALLPILTLCPSHSAGINRGKYILVPGTMNYSEEKMLEFFGQLLGVAMRADVPVAIDLLDCFWKNLKNEELTDEDLKEADALTYTLTQKIIEASDESVFNGLMNGVFHRNEDESSDRQYKFVYQNLRGFEEEVCSEGNEIELNYSNRIEYANAVRSFRLQELSCSDRVTAIRCGMASIIPLQVLRVLSASDLNLRVCGVADVDLKYLKLHTTYHVGLMEEDKHIQFFWKALESFSQDELRKFIKFACNQERIPFGEPCRGTNDNVVINVPPYPMKIAPPDGSDPPDTRYVRAETCMFLVKLPQYSSLELMTERLKYAINCREDPLSG